jgi:predicted MPP superfamily phosphohydrolase
VLGFQMPAMKKRIFIFGIWFFAEIYLWISIYKTFDFFSKKEKKSDWKKITEFVFTLLYWFPTLIIAGSMLFLVGKGIQNINQSNYLIITGICVIQYLIKFLLFLLLLGFDVVTYFIKRFFRSQFVVKTSRKRFLKIGLAIYIFCFLLLLYGMIYGADNFVVRKIEISTNHKALENKELKIILVSDLHLASWRTQEPIKKAIKLINEQNPDIVFLTGDYVQFSSSEFISYIPILQKLKAKYGIYSVLGNHDYGRYSYFPDDETRKKDVQKLVGYQRDLGWKVLLNQNEKLFLDSLENSITIAGIEYYSPKKLFVNEGNINKTFKNIDTSDYIIFLSHDPLAWHTVKKRNLSANLTLSGHTHGMQLGIYNSFIRWSPVSLLYKQWGGLYTDSHFPDKKLYVNIGLGSVGLPARVGVLPEITVIILR